MRSYFRLCVAICLASAVLAQRQRTWEEPDCTAAGEMYCLSCYNVGKCVPNNSTGTEKFYLEEIQICDGTQAMGCQETAAGEASCVNMTPLEEPGSECLRILGTDSGKECKADKYHPDIYGGYYIAIDEKYQTSPVKCKDYEKADVATCTCVPDETLCGTPCEGYVIAPDEVDCRRYFSCSGSSWTEILCIASQCFSSTECKCITADSGGETSNCPECGYKPDDDETTDNGYTFCQNGDTDDVQSCDTQIFVPESCTCGDGPTVPTEPPTEPPTKPSDECPSCGYQPDPNKEGCEYYVYCEAGNGPGHCEAGKCFVAATCTCE